MALWIVCAAVDRVGLAAADARRHAAAAGGARGAEGARRTTDPHAAVAQPEDEPVADEPAAQPVQAGPPEQLNRHDLENVIDHMRREGPAAVQGRRGVRRVPER